MRKPSKIDYTCECGAEITVTAWPLIPARINPPDLAHPEEGGDIEPEECPACGKPIDIGNIHERMEPDYEMLDRNDNWLFP